MVIVMKRSKKKLSKYEQAKRKKVKALKARLNRIKKQTGIIIEVDTKNIMRKRDEAAYKSLSVKNFLKGTMKLKYVTGVSGTQLQYDRTRRTVTRVPVYYGSLEGQQKLMDIMHYNKIMGFKKLRMTDLPKNMKYFKRWKTREDYLKWKEGVRDTAFQNLMNNLKAAESVDPRYSDIIAALKVLGKDVVDYLNDKNDFHILETNIFDSDHVLQEDPEHRTVWRANAKKFYKGIIKKIPGLDKYVELAKQRDEAVTEEDKDKIRDLMSEVLNNINLGGENNE